MSLMPGATWGYRAEITNDGTNSGNHDYRVTPGAGKDIQILYGSVRNADTTARTGRIDILSPDADVFGVLLGEFDAGVSITADQGMGYPYAQPFNAGGGPSAAGQPYMLAGTMDLRFLLQSVATLQNSFFTIVARIRAAVPTVVLTSPAGATETVDMNRVF